MTKNNQYNIGKFETIKFLDKKEPFYAAISAMKEMNYDIEDYIHHFPCFTGHMTIARFLALQECYQKTLGISGHIGEIGVYKGASLLFFAKLVQIFESQSLTQVHGFDWFQGNDPGEVESEMIKNSYYEPYERVKKLIDVQGLNNLCLLHKLDITKDLDLFFKQNSHLQFKLLFFDAGVYQVVKSALDHFWDRLSVGGILILDQFNHELAPGETKAVKEFLKDKKIHSFPYAFMPTAYIIK